MSKRTFIGGGRGIVLEDVGGSFARFVKESPRIARSFIHDAVEKSAFAMSRRMAATAPRGPDAPHIQQAIAYKRRGMRAEVGILEDVGSQPAAAGSSATMAEVALYNEYRPNRQPFMMPAAEAEAATFTRRVSDAVKQMERSLTSGVGT